MAGKRKAKPVVSRPGDRDALDEFKRGNMFVLSDDGKTGLLVPLMGGFVRDEVYQGDERQRTVVMVARVGDSEVEPVDKWHVQEWPTNKGMFRDYDDMVGETVGLHVVKVVRDGVKGAQDTKYHLSLARQIDGEAEKARVAELVAEATDLFAETYQT